MLLQVFKRVYGAQVGQKEDPGLGPLPEPSHGAGCIPVYDVHSTDGQEFLCLGGRSREAEPIRVWFAHMVFIIIFLAGEHE